MSIAPAPELSPDADGIVGGGMDWYSDTLPSAKWRFCDGALLSRTEFSLLFSRIGTSFSVGDGSTTFGLPNRAGKVAVGFDESDADFDTIGETGGTKVATMPAHDHDISPNPHNHTYQTAQYAVYAQLGSPVNTFDGSPTANTSSTSLTTSTEGGTGNNVPPYVVVRPIIKVM